MTLFRPPKSTPKIAAKKSSKAVNAKMAKKGHFSRSPCAYFFEKVDFCGYFIPFVLNPHLLCNAAQPSIFGSFFTFTMRGAEGVFSIKRQKMTKNHTTQPSQYFSPKSLIKSKQIVSILKIINQKS